MSDKYIERQFPEFQKDLSDFESYFKKQVIESRNTMEDFNAMPTDDAFIYADIKISELQQELDALRKELKTAKELFKDIHADLLTRGYLDSAGCTVVDLSSSKWIRLSDVVKLDK